MFYVVSRDYIGVDQGDAQFVDASSIEITHDPGDCETTHNDWVNRLLGEFSTLEEARSFINGCFGEDIRRVTAYSDFRPEEGADSIDGDSIELYKPGRYAPMTEDETEDWIFEGVQNHVDSATSDDEVSDLLCDFEAGANEEGLTLNANAREVIEQARRGSS